MAKPYSPKDYQRRKAEGDFSNKTYRRKRTLINQVKQLEGEMKQIYDSYYQLAMRDAISNAEWFEGVRKREIKQGKTTEKFSKKKFIKEYVDEFMSISLEDDSTYQELAERLNDKRVELDSLIHGQRRMF